MARQLTAVACLMLNARTSDGVGKADFNIFSVRCNGTKTKAFDIPRLGKATRFESMETYMTRMMWV